MGTGLLQHSRFDKKRTIILLRSVVVISTSYLIVFGQAPQAPASIAYIAALLLSNVALMIAPARWFTQPGFSALLLLGDTAAVLVGLYLTVGCFSQDFLIIYFFTIFLTTATSGLPQIAIGAAIISGVYGYWLWLTSSHVIGTGEWLRLPFFFIIAVFYAFVTEETKRERFFRERAESESERLRLLFNLGNALPQQVASEQLVTQIGTLVEAAFPRLRCQVPAEGAKADQPQAVFPVLAGGRSFGNLQVATPDGSPLWPNEAAFCKVAAVIAANALYMAEQVSAPQAGLDIRDTFLSTLSHELRTPLHVILGNTEILHDVSSLNDDPLVRETIDRLRANACRLLDLIQELLCFAELRAGKSVVQREPVDLRELFHDCRTTMMERLAGRLVNFAVHVAADVPPLVTDARKLRLIVNGLLSNAAKFTEHGFVRLTAEPCGEQVVITVFDSGIGINTKDISTIFQAFRQLDDSLTRRYQGLGLGLALVQELATALGGSVTVQSQPNQGSTFRVYLPLVPPAASPDWAAEGAEGSLRWSPAS
jgi:signal transduction histidine kinase